ncbi:C39 family peptidase [Candidatus Woesearchaeota archaeon]|nr:C39 family peptidase [Candidatus Woesearchaeota archaeon]
MLQIKPFMQKTGFSCGPASLKIVLEYYGIHKTEKQLVRLTNCTYYGTNAKNLLKTAEILGLKGFIIENAKLNDIKKYVVNKKIPVIVDWFSENDGHYSVIVDINKENIYFIDPEIGHVRAMKIEDFLRLWFDFPFPYIRSKNDLLLRTMIVLYK